MSVVRPRTPALVLPVAGVVALSSVLPGCGTQTDAGGPKSTRAHPRRD